jgi:F0F1-type ATP synthase membrane subunit b/b'
MIQQIDDEGSSQSVYVKQEAQDLLDQITKYRDQAQNAANNAYNDALKIIDDSRVKTSEQSLSDTQKAQARTNIDAVSESELKAALEELIIEYGGTIPSD